MPVYMIRAGESGPIKIGYSADPLGRLSEFQVSHYEQLTIIRLFEGGEPEEAALHMRFADLRIRGEWHSFSRLMMGDVGLVEVPVPQASSRRANGLAHKIIAAFGGATKMAGLLDCGVTTVSNWHRTGFPRSREIDLIDLARREGVAGVTAITLRAATAAAIEADAQISGPRKPGRPAREPGAGTEAA